MKTYAYALSAMLALQGAVMAADAPAAAPAPEATPAAAAPAAAAPAKAAPAKTKTLSGAVVSTDAVGNTIVIKGKKADETVSVPATAKIMEGGKAVALADIAAGSKVVVKYTEENGAKTAASVKVTPAAAAAKTKAKTEAPKAAEPATPEAPAAK